MFHSYNDILTNVKGYLKDRLSLARLQSRLEPAEELPQTSGHAQPPFNNSGDRRRGYDEAANVWGPGQVPYNASCERKMAITLIKTLQQNPNPHPIPPYRIYEVLANCEQVFEKHEILPSICDRRITGIPTFCLPCAFTCWLPGTICWMGLMHNAIETVTKIPHGFKFYGEAFAVRTGGGGCLFFYSAKNRQMAQQLTLDIPGYKIKRDDSWINKKQDEMIPIYTNITLNLLTEVVELTQSRLRLVSNVLNTKTNQYELANDITLEIVQEGFLRSTFVYTNAVLEQMNRARAEEADHTAGSSNPLADSDINTYHTSVLFKYQQCEYKQNLQANIVQAVAESGRKRPEADQILPDDKYRDDMTKITRATSCGVCLASMFGIGICSFISAAGIMHFWGKMLSSATT